MAVIVVLLLLTAALIGFLAYRANQQESAEFRTIRSLPPSIQHVVAQMDGGAQAAFFNEYEAKKKKRSVAYLLWLFLGIHYLYARKVGLQFAYWFTFYGFGLWAFADLFRMPSIVRSVNEQMAREALQTLHIGVAFANLPAASPLLTQNPVPTLQPPPPVPAVVTTPVAGQWATDPAGRYARRYHDGARWTEHVETDGVLAVDYM